MKTKNVLVIKISKKNNTFVSSKKRKIIRMHGTFEMKTPRTRS